MKSSSIAGCSTNATASIPANIEFSSMSNFTIFISINIVYPGPNVLLRSNWASASIPFVTSPVTTYALVSPGSA